MNNNVTEAEALEIFWDFRRRFGWSGVLWTREDAESVWDTYFDDEFTDEVWELVRKSPEWRGLSSDEEGDVRLIGEAILDARLALGLGTEGVE